jgi:hypothetical protein
VARRQRLSEAQIAELFDPPTDQRELVRHFTLSPVDIAAVLRCWGDRNHLGYALMLCCLRYPGRALRKYLRSGSVEPKFKVPDRPSKLDAFADKLSDWLKSETAKSRKQKRDDQTASRGSDLAGI